MNAARRLLTSLDFVARRRLASLPARRFDDFGGPVVDRFVDDDASLLTLVCSRFEHSLLALLNACNLSELVTMARAVGIDSKASPGVRRLALWHWGAALEAAGATVTRGLQPVPVLLASRLVMQHPPQGLYPPSSSWPRPVPAAASATPPDEEPATLDELLAAADAALGVRLGPRGTDKGAWGVRAAALLGVVERGDDEPDWRGDVELKTVPVVREASGLWRIAEDPAISMADASPLAKLQRVLWLVRASLDDDATLIGWYLMTWDGDVPRLVRKYLHLRPKGPAGTSARGWYLHKRFFAECGLLSTLNGDASAVSKR